MEKQKGKVKSISTKRPGFHAFTLRDVKDEQGNDIWFSGKGQPEFNKGDLVEFEFVITQNGQYTNRNISTLKVLDQAQGKQDKSFIETRVNVDAGNMVSFAKDIVCASLSNGNTIQNLKEMIKDMTIACTSAFVESKNILEGNDKKEPEVQQDPQIEYQNMSDY